MDKKSLRTLISSLKREHYTCSDGFYSCPLSPEGTLSEDEGCTCGADENNRKIEICLTLLR